MIAVAVGPQHEGAVDGVAAAVPARARRAADVDVGTPAEHDRAGRQSTQPSGAVKDLAHALPVIQAVAQLEQLAAVRRSGERGEERVAVSWRVVVVVVMAVTVEVVGPAAGAAPRARDGGQAAWGASRAAPVLAGLSGEASSPA